MEKQQPVYPAATSTCPPCPTYSHSTTLTQCGPDRKPEEKSVTLSHHPSYSQGQTAVYRPDMLQCWLPNVERVVVSVLAGHGCWKVVVVVVVARFLLSAPLPTTAQGPPTSQSNSDQAELSLAWSSQLSPLNNLSSIQTESQLILFVLHIAADPGWWSSGPVHHLYGRNIRSHQSWKDQT